MCFVSRVKAAFLSGEYAKVVALHEQAMEARLELAPIYRFNRFSAERRWRSLCQAPRARGARIARFLRSHGVYGEYL